MKSTRVIRPVKTDDLNASQISEILDQEEGDDIYLDDFDRKNQTLTFIPNIEKQFEILTQSSTKRTNKAGISSYKPAKRYANQKSLNESIDETIQKVKKNI